MNATQTKKLDTRLGQGLFVRAGLRPDEDLERGASYQWGDFGGQEHDGLSGYNVSRLGLVDALTELACYFDDRAGMDADTHITVFRGGERGGGPDGEDLFHPTEIVANTLRGTDSWRSVYLALKAQLETAGYQDEVDF